MSRQFPALITTSTAPEVADAICRAATAHGLTVTEGLVRLLLAQSALETGHWRRHETPAGPVGMRCWSMGNQKAHPDWEGDYAYWLAGETLTAAQLAVARRTPEGLRIVRLLDGGGAVVEAVEPHPLARFRAYADLEAGAMGWLDKLVTDYATALPHLARGHVTDYCAALRRGRLGSYYTATETHYRSRVASLAVTYHAVARDAWRRFWAPLDATDVYVTRVEDVEVGAWSRADLAAGTNWVTLASGHRITAMPVGDRRATGGWARLGHGQADAWAREAGYRLPTVAEYEELHRAAVAAGGHVEPYTLPLLTMLDAHGVPPPWQDGAGRDTPAMAAYRASHMRSRAWCDHHDAEVRRRLRAAGYDGGPVDNAGKHWAAGGVIVGWWVGTGGLMIQRESRFHASDPTYTDYATTFHVVRECPATAPPPADGVPRLEVAVDDAPHQHPGSAAWWRPVLERGMRGRDVHALQVALYARTDLGTHRAGAKPDAVPERAVFGAGTEGAVRELQRVHRLEVDGRVGSATRRVLFPDDRPAPEPTHDPDWLDELDRIPARWWQHGRPSGPSLGPVLHIVAPAGKRQSARYLGTHFASLPQEQPASTHFGVDDVDTVQYVPLSGEAFAAVGGRRGDHIELCTGERGVDFRDPATWRDARHTAMLERVAQLVARLCRLRGIEPRWGTVDDYLAQTERHIWSHQTITLATQVAQRRGLTGAPWVVRGVRHVGQHEDTVPAGGPRERLLERVGELLG